MAGWGISFAAADDLERIAVLGPHATDYLRQAGIRSADALEAAVPLELSSILALHKHAEPVALAAKVLGHP